MGTDLNIVVLSEKVRNETDYNLLTTEVRKFAIWKSSKLTTAERNSSPRKIKERRREMIILIALRGISV
jgi:hypothetical protein